MEGNIKKKLKNHYLTVSSGRRSSKIGLSKPAFTSRRAALRVRNSKRKPPMDLHYTRTTYK